MKTFEIALLLLVFGINFPIATTIFLIFFPEMNDLTTVTIVVAAIALTWRSVF